jgi:acylphosphatase
MTTSYRFIVTGRVQGVGFRQATCWQATALKLRGWVRNRADGRVEGWVFGSEDVLNLFQQWLQAGPPSARVDRVDWIEANPEEVADPGADPSADRTRNQTSETGFRIER